MSWGGRKKGRKKEAFHRPTGVETIEIIQHLHLRHSTHINLLLVISKLLKPQKSVLRQIFQIFLNSLLCGLRYPEEDPQKQLACHRPDVHSRVHHSRNVTDAWLCLTLLPRHPVTSQRPESCSGSIGQEGKGRQKSVSAQPRPSQGMLSCQGEPGSGEQMVTALTAYL